MQPFNILFRELSTLVVSSTSRHRPPQHGVGLRRRHLRRQGHQAHAELGKDKVQEDQHRQAAQLHHPRGEHGIAQTLTNSAIALLTFCDEFAFQVIDL